MALVALIGALSASVPRAVAQTDLPDAPTAVAVYSIESQKLEARWSSSDSSVTSFTIQWKSGAEEFDSSRQLSSDPATSIESAQSTTAGDRYVDIITGLTDGTEYTVRVLATNSSGDSGSSNEATGTPQSTPGQSREFVENEVVEILESSFPWLRETWDYMTAQNAYVNFGVGRGGIYNGGCGSPVYLTDSDLWRCKAFGIVVGRSDPEVIDVIIHELGHVYTLTNDVASAPAPLGIAHLYFLALVSPDGRGGPGSACDAKELYADGLLILTLGHGARDRSRYWRQCSVIDDTVSEQALGVLGSAAAGQMPSWFADTYNDSVGDPDLARVWADVKAMLGALDRQRAVVYQLRDAFGGYCDDSKATESAFADGVARNPWGEGGCVPAAPANVAATGVGTGKLTVSWQEPPDDGGSPIEGYSVQWKSGTQEYDSSRQAVVTDLTDLQHTISGLTNDVSHTIRVVAYNHNGDGAAAETTATPTATDTTAPTLLLARLHERNSWVRLIWNEALDASSVPVSTAFTVNYNGVSRGIGTIAVRGNGNVLHIGLGGVSSATDTVTVTYTAPTGSGANPLKDAAGNNVASFSGQMVRNDRTQVAFTSDPGADMTYIFRNGFGGQDVIEATVTFSEPVLVSGEPELELLVGGETRHALYRSGSGTTSVVFRYVLTEGEIDTDGISVPRRTISTDAGLIRYASSKAVVPAEVVLGPQGGHRVDAVRPTLVSADALANGREVALTWDRALDEDSGGNVFFRVRDTSDDTSRQDTAISVRGRVVFLTLSSVISATDQLTVSYEDVFRQSVEPIPHRKPLRDTLGNHAGNNSAVVSIFDTPNRSPEFPTAEDGSRSVDENTPAGRNIGTPIVATDADNDRLTYSISRHPNHLFNVFDVFDVDATTGQLRTKGALDEEMRDWYRLTMSVSDGKDPYGNADTTIDDTISVIVTVNDVDEPPVITPDYDIVVDENHEGRLAGFNAYDPERRLHSHTLSLAGRDAGDFSLADDGVLTFASTPDYERPADLDRNNVYDLTVNAVDGDGKIGSIDISVTVWPVDEPPDISGDATPSLEEEGALLVGTYQAVDPENATTVWQPLGGSDRDKFEFTASNGRLAFKSAPDFEDPADTGGNNAYDVRLSAWAGSQTTTLDVRVTITNKDEDGTLSLSSPQPQVDADYTATLSDPDTVVSTTWTWERSTSRTSGWAAVSGATDGVTTSVYMPVAGDVGYYLRVSAAYTDGHGPNKSLVQRSANPVRTAPVTNDPPSFDEPTPTRSIAENARARAAVGSPVGATDTDSGDVLTYELSGSDLFTIDSNSGQIRVVADNSLDHESAPSHSVTVKASDTSNAFDTVTVSVTVDDVNEPPNAVPDASTTREDTEVTIDVLANDSDPEDDVSDLMVSAGNARRGQVVVNTPQNTGEFYTITYTPRANYNGADSFTYTVQDSGSPSRSDSATVSINVGSVNDDPTFPSTTAGRSVLESAGEGDDVGAPVTATDIDGDELTYSLSGTDAGFFDIGPRSGQITVGAGVTLDIATRDTYTVMVDADDANGGRASVEVAVTVTTRSVRPPIITTGGGGGGGGGPANRPPVFLDTDGNAITETLREIVEDAALDARVGEPVAATDPDEDTLTYSLGGDDAPSFAIDASTGQLTTATALDYETRASYAVTVIATDPSAASSTIAVVIDVTDVDEAPLLMGAASVDYPENDTGPVGSYRATDPEEAAVAWSLSGSDAHAFAIDNGTLAFNTPPDYEAATDRNGDNAHSVVVTASDGTNVATLEVSVVVTNLEEPGMVILSSGAPTVGMEISATLTDPDGSIAGTAWLWEKSADQAVWAAISGAARDAYTTVAGDLGHYLRVTARYADGEGPGKVASRAMDTAVAAEAAGEGEVSSPAEPQLVGPLENLTVSVDGQEAGAVRLDWIPAENAQVHFVVSIKSADLATGNYRAAKMAPLAGSEGVVSGLEGGTSYYFIVIGMRWNWVEYGTVWGTWSPWVSATPNGDRSNAETVLPGAEPQFVGPLENLTVSVDGQEAGAVRLAWTPAENAQVHFVAHIKSADLAAGNYRAAEMAPFAGSEGVVSGLEGGTSYYFIVIGMRWNWVEYGTVWGTWSSWVLATPIASAPKSGQPSPAPEP